MRFPYYLIFLLLITFGMAAQEINPDAVMQDVKREVEKGNYDKALSMIEPLHQKFPQDEDITTYIGRIYSWKKNYTAAIEILAPLAEKSNPDALLAIINTYFWSEQLETCIVYCDKYLAIDPNSIDVKLIKVKCLEQLNRDKEALAILEKIEVTENSTLAVTGLRTLIGRKAKNAIAASYLNISTSNPGQAPMHYGYIEYSHKFRKSSLIGRANIGHVNNDTQLLFEADYYKSFAKKDYLYVNGGVSTGQTIFPIARGGIEYYFVPQKKFDYALGLRYMHFENDDVTLVTGQFAYHAGSYTFAYRPFYDTGNDLFSHVLSIQHANEEKENLIRLELQYGSVPYLYLYNNSVKPLNAYRIGLQYQQRLGNSFFVRPVFLYEYEEYLPGEYRNKFNLQVIVTKRF